MKVLVQKISEYAQVPKYQTSGSVGMDLSSVEETVVLAGKSALVGSGIKIALPIGYEAQVRPRSGLAVKHAITVLNTPGTIDSDYRGEVKVILFNHGKDDFKISRGDRIAQLVINKVELAELKEVEKLEDTERGESGFGSTGK